jgi:hypothetical protein
MRRGCNDCAVGSVFPSGITRFDSPDDGPVKANRWGAKARPPGCSIVPAALL